MSSLPPPSPAPVAPIDDAPSPPLLARETNDPVSECVRLALFGAEQSLRRLERRRERRHPYPHLVLLTPVARDGGCLLDETIVVIGKHLSEHGLDFYHREPVAHRRMIASLETGAGRYVGLLLDLTWCRFTRHGWYDNGGRFLSVAESPLAAASPHGLF